VSAAAMKEISDWLEKLGMSEYAERFAENKIDVSVLRHLTDQDLKDIGVPLGHRRKILAAIGKLADAASAPPKAAATAPKIQDTAERRQLTVLFSDLVGSTALSARMDPEDLHEIIATYQQCVTEIVRRFRGFVAKYMGDGVLVYFGYPQAHEDDADRAVRAGLELVAAVSTLQSPVALQARVGIATGVVVVGDLIGSGAAQERGIVGETPNLAARLQALAEPNTVVVAQGTRRLAGGKFEYCELGRHSLKGFGEPVPAWRVVSANAEESRSEALRSNRGPLVGRRLELEQLRAVLSACRTDGRGRAVYVRGEAGIGKTRLLEALLSIAREQGFACHTGLVLDFGTAAGRDAIGALARDLLGLRPNASDDSVAALLRAFVSGLVERDDEVFLNDLLQVPQPIALRAEYDAMDNRTRAEGKRRTIVRLVERSSRLQPRVLAVEDLHWADIATLTHLATLTTVVADCPAVLVMTSRFEQDPLDHSWRAETSTSPLIAIDLGPLSLQEAATLAAPFLGANAEVTQRCLERAAGNPLFLEQLLHDAAEGDGSAIPASLQSLVQARLDRLDPSDKAAFQAASVLGQRFDRGALAHLLNEPAFDRLVAARLVHTFGHEFLFAHALIHEAVYDSLLKSRRRELHVRAADWFAPRDASLKASHLDRAGDAAAAAAYLEAAQGQRQEYRFDAGRKLAARGLEPIKSTSSLSTASSARSSSISGTCQRHWRRS
jgi:class 3 adenylate cyclase